MLIVWSSADASSLKTTVGPVIASSRVEHKIIPNMTKVPDCGPGDVILACGSKAVELLGTMGLIPKKRTVGSMREKPIVYNGATIFTTYDPGICSRDYARLPEVQWDVQLCIRLLTTGSLKPVIGTYRYVDSLHELIARVEEKYEKTGAPVDLACDLETKSLNPYNPAAWIIAASFTVDEGKSDVLYFTSHEKPVRPLPWKDVGDMTYWEGLWTQINWLLTTPKVSTRGANFKYDSNWLFQKWEIYCTNHKFDTMLVGSLLDENRSNSLKLHAKIMTPMGGYEDDMDKYDFGSLEVVPKHEMLNYVGGDTDATYRVANVMRSDICKDARLANFYVKLLHPASKVFEKMERTGILVDREYYQRLEGELRVEINRLQDEMLQCMPNKMRIKYKDEIGECLEDGKSPFKPKILKEFLFTPAGLNLKPKVFTEKTKEPSTSMDHLMMFEDDEVAKEFISRFRELGSASKTLSTFVTGFLKHLRQDNRFHATYMLHRGDYDGEDSGTNTGRTSAKDPAVQCQRGSSLICCKDGRHTIKSIVEGVESGRDYLVKSHTGSWRRVGGVYRNGIKPVFEVTTRSGMVTGCTENHPLLLVEGFVRTDATNVGDLVFVDKDWHGTEGKEQPTRAQVFKDARHWKGKRTQRSLALSLRLWHGKVREQSGLTRREGKVLRVLEKRTTHLSRSRGKGRITNLHFLGGDVASSARHHWGARGFEALRGGYRRSKMGVFREFSRGYGGAAYRNHVGPQGEFQGILQGQLPLGHCFAASPQSNQQLDAYVQWADAMRSRMGRDYRAGDEFVLPATSRLDRGRGFVDSQRAAQAGFVLDPIVSIRYVGDEETFDITVEEDHSFVSDGFVVHNTIPKHSKWAKRLRRALIAPPGYVIIQCDFSQGELRITAVVAEEPTMIQAYASGADLHAITAAQLNGYEFHEFMLLPEDVRDELRSGGKAGNFGLIYGMQHKGFRDYAYTTYGVSMTEEEAFQKREAFFALYNRLPAWHEEFKNHAKHWGYVRSPLGRVRHLPLINSKDREIVSQSERQAINSPIQSCLSDMMQLAMVHIDRIYGEEDIHMFLMTHDSLALYVPEDDAVEWAKRIKGVMENLPLERDFGWNSPLKFVADAEMSVPDDSGIMSMASLKKLKGI